MPAGESRRGPVQRARTMRLFRKTFLWMSVGCLSAASAAAQSGGPRDSGVTLCRPQPLAVRNRLRPCPLHP